MTKPRPKKLASKPVDGDPKGPVKITGRNGCRGIPGPGRPKGVPNKTTTMIKQAFTDAFFQTGGVEGLVDWVKESKRNRAQFYALILKIVPTAVDLSGTINLAELFQKDD